MHSNCAECLLITARSSLNHFFYNFRPFLFLQNLDHVSDIRGSIDILELELSLLISIVNLNIVFQLLNRLDKCNVFRFFANEYAILIIRLMVSKHH